ncbi:hypothetical protein P9112_008952 [Eukaryota sp. TZLM1-RC]
MSITTELLRKRAEHNDGCLRTLREVTLHQQNLQRIDTVGTLCKQLEILFLQCNYITKIENLYPLKRLRYLNLAVNGITTIENLDRCESLEKLDFTANFIDNIISIQSLRDLFNLKEVYLVGNPICEFDHYRLFIISQLPQLLKLDGTEIQNTERLAAKCSKDKLLLQAKQWYDHRTLIGLAGKRPPNWKDMHKDANINIGKSTKSNFETNTLSYDEIRMKTPPLQRDGKIVQVNQPRVDFRLYEEFEDKEVSVGSVIVLEVHISKFVSTSLIDVDVQPLYVEVRIKGALVRVALSEEVFVQNSEVVRSTSTGNLVVRMPKVTPVDSIIEIQQPPKRICIGKSRSIMTRFQEDQLFLKEVSTIEQNANDEQYPDDDDSDNDLPPLE